MRKTRSPLRALLALSTVLAVSLALSGSALAAHTIEIRDYDERAHGCEALGLDGFKIEAEYLEEGEHNYEIYDNGTLLFSVTLDISKNSDDELATLESWSNANPSVDTVLITAGGETTVWPVHPVKTQGADAGENREISHIEFCLGEPPATDPPATDPPATDPPATDPPATDPPATDPPATDPPATDPPATDPPSLTPPPTSMSDTGSGSGPANTLLVLLVGAMAAAWLLLRPMAPSPVRAGRRGQR
jgi:hypothetical protein